MKLTIWTIYDRPSDFPSTFVARKFEIRPGVSDPVLTKDFVVAPDLEQIRGYLRGIGLVSVPRSQGDASCVVESWI